jgi:hypothetical protein
MSWKIVWTETRRVEYCYRGASLQPDVSAVWKDDDARAKVVRGAHPKTLGVRRQLVVGRRDSDRRIIKERNLAIGVGHRLQPTQHRLDPSRHQSYNCCPPNARMRWVSSTQVNEIEHVLER